MQQRGYIVTRLVRKWMPFVCAQLVVSASGTCVVVSVWVDAGAGWASVVSTSCWDCRVGSLVLITNISSGCASSGASIPGLVRCTDSVSVLEMMGSKAVCADSSELSILVVCGIGGLWGASTLEPRATRAGGVVVGWRWAVSLLALVVTSKPDLDKSAEEEEEGSNDSNGEADLVQAARESVAGGEGDILVAASAKAA